LQNPVGFASALAVSRLMAAKRAFLRGCSFKTEVLKEPHQYIPKIVISLKKN
jgi:hypothetical protein